jgi:hypothetical protein
MDRDPMDYDEDIVLFKYVSGHELSLMTDLERRVAGAIITRAKAQGFESRGASEAARMLSEKWGHAGDPQVEAALADGPEAFRRRVSQRVLSDPRARALINRCPRCQRIVRTPAARQCFWCGHDWHEGRA